jgi:alpha-N-arabinofuranosidase
MEMYNVHQDAALLPLNIESANYRLGNESLPAVSGSASKDSTGLVHISLTNINPNKEEQASIAIGGQKFAKVSGRILTSKKLQDHNTFEEPEKITPQVVTGAVLKENNLNVKLPPFSVVVLELK